GQVRCCEAKPQVKGTFHLSAPPADRCGQGCPRLAVRAPRSMGADSRTADSFTPMTNLRCPFHDVPFRDATICPSCLHDLERDLGDIPALIDEIHITLSRQARIDAAGSVVGEDGQDADEDRTCQHCYGRGRRYWQDAQPRCL